MLLGSQQGGHTCTRVHAHTQDACVSTLESTATNLFSQSLIPTLGITLMAYLMPHSVVGAFILTVILQNSCWPLCTDQEAAPENPRHLPKVAKVEE